MQRLSISLLDLEFNYYHTHLDVTVFYPEGNIFHKVIPLKDHGKMLDTCGEKNICIKLRAQ